MRIGYGMHKQCNPIQIMQSHSIVPKIININPHIPYTMSSSNPEYNQPQQTLQFYKIQLMQKEREISDHTSKLKKLQFKTNRDMKELKMAEEKAKNLLKDEKLKLEKLNKTYAELQDKLGFLVGARDQKERELEALKMQYAGLRNQVRSYQRILPTHDFMLKLGADYDSLPTYEQVFFDLKEQTEKIDEIQERMRKLQAESEEKIEMQINVMENLQKKKVQLEKQLRQDISKILELESQVTTLTMQREQLQNTVQQAQDLLLQQQQSLTQESQHSQTLQSQLQQLTTLYTRQLQQKEIQHQQQLTQQSQNHEQQLQQVTRRFESKQQSHLQQLAYFEEEEQRMYETMLRDKEKFQENYRDMLKQVDRIRGELEVEKDQHSRYRQELAKVGGALATKEAESLGYLHKIGQDQRRIGEMEAEIEKLREKIAKANSQSKEKIGNFADEKRELEDKIMELMGEVGELTEICNEKQNQITVLMNEIEQLKNPRNSFQPHPSTPPPKPQSILQDLQPRSRHQSISTQKAHRSSIQFYTQQQLSAAVSDSIRIYEKEWVQKLENAVKEKEKLQMLFMQSQERGKEIGNLCQGEIGELRDKVAYMEADRAKILGELDRQRGEFREMLDRAAKKYQILKTEKDKISQTYDQILIVSKKDKESLNSLIAQNRDTQKSNKQLQKTIQSLSLLPQPLPQPQPQPQAHPQPRQHRSLSVSTSPTPNQSLLKQTLYKYQTQITNLTNQLNKLSTINQNLQTQINHLRKYIDQQAKQLEQIKCLNGDKQRQIWKLQDLLDSERKNRDNRNMVTIRTVDSLASLNQHDLREPKEGSDSKEEVEIRDCCCQRVQAELDELKAQFEEARESFRLKENQFKEEINVYLHEIIAVKLRVADAEMKASQKSHLYNQLKKKYNIL